MLCILWLICGTAPGAGAAFGLVGKPEEYEERAIEPDEIGIGQTAETIAYICPRHRGDFVDHDVAWLLNSGHRCRLHSDSGQRRLDGIGCQRADHDRGRGIEPIVLNNDDGSGLTRVGTSCGSEVYMASPHSADSRSSSAQLTEIASTYAWSSASCSLAAMAADWR